MTDLRVGYDYHLAQPRRHSDFAESKRVASWWEAVCDACGYVGPKRETRVDAEDDAVAHDIASNPARRS